MALPTIHHTFRLVTDPEARATANGTPIAKLRLAANSSKKNDRGEWVDADRFFLRATAFGRVAEAVAEANFRQGEEITVRGRIKTDQWETPEGEKRSGNELLADEVGRPARPPRRNDAPSTSAPPQGDPWGTGSSFANEPPF